MLSCLVVSDSSRLHGLQPARLLCPWDFPGKNAGVGCHFLLQRSSQPRDPTCIPCVSCIGRRILSHCTTWEARREQTCGCHGGWEEDASLGSQLLRLILKFTVKFLLRWIFPLFQGWSKCSCSLKRWIYLSRKFWEPIVCQGAQSLYAYKEVKLLKD